jgi:hypothetical protein
VSTSKNSDPQPDKLKKVVQVALINDNFRTALTDNLQQAIDSNRQELGFGYNDLSQTSRDVLTSLTPDELDTLREIFQKAQKGGIQPNEMF